MLTDLGGQCLMLVLGASVAGVLLGVVFGAIIGWLGARPLMRWGLGEDPVIGCVATAVLVFSGLAGGLWAGAWAGAGACARHAIGERFLVEDIVITSLVVAATEGEPSGDPEVDGQRMRDAVQAAGGSLSDLLEQVGDEVREEAETELPEFLAPEAVAELLAAVETNELFKPEAMVRISAVGGLAVAAEGADADLASYSEKIIAIGEPVRHEVLFAIYAAVISNAVVTAVVAVAAPLVVLLMIAGVSRLIRMSGRRRPPRPKAAPSGKRQV